MNSKVFIGVVSTAALISLGAYWFFSKSNQDKKPYLLHLELEQLSKHLDRNHPSQAQIHQLYSFILSQAKKKSSKDILSFKNQRRKILSQDFSKYLRFIQSFLIQIKGKDIQTKQQILSQLQMTQQQFNNAVIRFSDSFSSPLSLPSKDLPVLSIQKLRKVIQSQTEIVKTRGLDIITRIQKQIGNEGKQWIQQIFNVALEDEILSIIVKDPQIYQYNLYSVSDQADSSTLLQRSSIVHREQLREEIQNVKGILLDIFSKIEQ